MENVLQTFKERIATATANKSPLRIKGNGTKDWYGQSLQGEVLDTTAYSGIIA